MAKVALQGSRTLGITKWPWSCCRLFLCQSTRKSRQTWCRQTDAAGTGEGFVPSSTTQWVHEYPTYSWQMQQNQLSKDFLIWPPSSFPFRHQDLLRFCSSLPYSNPFPQSTVQMCLYCKKSWMGSGVNSTNNIAGRGCVQHSELTLFGSFPLY